MGRHLIGGMYSDKDEAFMKEMLAVVEENVNQVSAVLKTDHSEFPMPEECTAEALCSCLILHLQQLAAIHAQLEPMVYGACEACKLVNKSRQAGAFSLEQILALARRLTNTSAAPAHWRLAGPVPHRAHETVL
eukprot:Platyproteum_vivax@DN7494_c0_g2_i3.p1